MSGAQVDAFDLDRYREACDRLCRQEAQDAPSVTPRTLYRRCRKRWPAYVTSITRDAFHRRHSVPALREVQS